MNKYVKKIIIFFSIIMTICIFLNYSKALTPVSQNIYDGIDVSNWQGYISYKDVKNAGIDIVYIKASQGTTYKDPYMEYNYKEAKSNGLKVGFYHFLTATNEEQAKKQAQFFASVISGKEVDCKLAMDFEQFNNGITVTDIRRISNVFLETVKQLTGKDVIVYSNLNDAKNVFGSEIASKYPLWLAYYTTENRVLNATSAWNVWYGWQYTSRGTVPGINGYVDRNKFTSNILLKQSSEIPIVEVPEDIKVNKVEYIVKKGDTLSEIAMRYNTTVAELVSQNNISNPNLIYPGQMIYISTKNAQNVETNEMGCIVYTVKKGDTLWNIAKKYGTTVNQITTCNKISNPNLIYPGQKIRIRVVNAVDVSNTNKIRYVVKKGDTLSEIARKYNTTVKKIAADNGIKNVNLIYIGQVIEL